MIWPWTMNIKSCISKRGHSIRTAYYELLCCMIQLPWQHFPNRIIGMIRNLSVFVITSNRYIVRDSNALLFYLLFKGWHRWTKNIKPKACPMLCSFFVFIFFLGSLLFIEFKIDEMQFFPIFHPSDKQTHNQLFSLFLRFECARFALLKNATRFECRCFACTTNSHQIN